MGRFGRLVTQYLDSTAHGKDNDLAGRTLKHALIITPEPIADDEIPFMAPMCIEPKVCLGNAVQRQRLTKGDLEADCRCALFFGTLEQASGRIMRDLWKAGVREFYFERAYRPGCWQRMMPTSALARKATQRLRRTPRTNGRNGKLPPSADPAHDSQFEGDIACFRDALRNWRTADEARTLMSAAGDQCGRTLLAHTSSLNSGGAERQMVNLLVALSRLTQDADEPPFTRLALRTRAPLLGAHAHFLADLNRKGAVEVRRTGEADPSKCQRWIDGLSPERRSLIMSLPLYLRESVLDMVFDIDEIQPEVLLCSLDDPNIIGALAGLCALKPPRIGLSMRNVNPTHFDYIYQPWMRVWYRFIAEQPEVILTSNSQAGALDYAHWLDIDPKRFTVIPNSVDPMYFEAPANDEISAVRHELGLTEGDQVILGVFRLSQEKRPELFLDVVARVADQLPQVRAVIAGIGPLEEALGKRIERDRLLRNRVRLTGRRADPRVLYGIADILLLTSSEEGMPNCILEAMAMGLPVVATNVGGVSEIVEDRQTGLLVEPGGGADAFVMATLAILNNRELAVRLGRAGRQTVTHRHSPPSMLRDYLELLMR